MADCFALIVNRRMGRTVFDPATTADSVDNKLAIKLLNGAGFKANVYCINKAALGDFVKIPSPAGYWKLGPFKINNADGYHWTMLVHIMSDGTFQLVDGEGRNYLRHPRDLAFYDRRTKRFNGLQPWACCCLKLEGSI